MFKKSFFLFVFCFSLFHAPFARAQNEAASMILGGIFPFLVVALNSDKINDKKDFGMALSAVVGGVMIGRATETLIKEKKFNRTNSTILGLGTLFMVPSVLVALKK